jgi:hypothetical protein
MIKLLFRPPVTEISMITHHESLHPRRIASFCSLASMAIISGLVSLSAPANATEANPLLGSTANAPALTADQMDKVQGTGYWANYYGNLGLTYLGYASGTAYYARWYAAHNSSSEYNGYNKAGSYAKTAQYYLGLAATASNLHR